MAQLLHQPTDLNGPAYFPPPGVEPKLDGRSDGDIYSYTLLPIFGVLTAAFLILRIYTKAYIVRKLNAPDCKLTLELLAWYRLIRNRSPPPLFSTLYCNSCSRSSCDKKWCWITSVERDTERLH
jgi:hypothetical protein